ncbi:MAG: ATPase, T2SS/T4P/T4SS family [Candidatus Micrarchaeia archaeon]|jgi:flagellar protein FlaI
MATVSRGYPFSFYSVEPVAYSESEQKLVSAFLDLVYRRLSVDDFCAQAGMKDCEALDSFVNSIDDTKIGKPVSQEDFERFGKNVREFCSQFDVDAAKVAKSVADSVYGYRVVQPFFDDGDLEEIMINGAGTPIIVYHRQLGPCKTSLSFRNDRELSSFVAQISRATGEGRRVVFEDLRLPDKSRANISFPPATRETVITIRKFRKQPMTFVDLVRNGTVSAELAAFLWVCGDGMMLYPLNVLVVGGTASGKTTTLNALSAFVPPSERIISIEDTLELNFAGRENWVAMESGTEEGLDGLLKNSLRMRPDRLIVGEVRGSEAETLFTAMNIGHRGTMGTLHANSDRDAVKRLENAPMDVPRALLPLVDVVVVQHRINDRRKGLLRRVTQVSEVSRIEDQIALNEIYKWDPREDEIYRTDSTSESLEKLAKATGSNVNALKEELGRRRDLIKYLIERNISTPADVAQFMQAYYSETTGQKKKEPAD